MRKSSSRPRVLYPRREEGQGQARHVEINIPVTQCADDGIAGERVA